VIDHRLVIIQRRSMTPHADAYLFALVPIGTAQLIPARVEFSPLLKEKRHAEALALVADGPRPVWVHRPSPRPALAANDDPGLGPAADRVIRQRPHEIVNAHGAK
jgi:hypothetical protein